MSLRALRPLGLLLGLTLFLAACEEAPTGPAPESEPEPELAPTPELAMDQLATEAVRDGDAERADFYRGGAIALRLGVRPSEIEVRIQNETFVYKAIMVGVVRIRGDQRVLFRTLLAWTGEPRPEAILQVASRTDLGLFGQPDHADGGVTDNPGRARGRWADLVNRERWVATSGSAGMELVETGAACPIPTTTDAAFGCVLARYDIRINGVFRPAGSDQGGPPKPIHTNADGVNGVVLSPVSD